MKKLFTAVACAAFTLAFTAAPSIKVKAQQTKLIVKAITGADTVAFANVPSKMRCFQYTVTKTSGALAGKLILEGTVNGTYVGLDSLVLADIATAQTLKYIISASTGTSYLTYRFRCTNTSAAPSAVRAGWLRRTDD